MSVEEDAYRYAVKNAYEHGGKANPSAVLGKVAALHPKEDVKKLIPSIRTMTERVNRMGQEELGIAYAQFQEGFELKPKKQEVGLPKLEWAMEGEKVITRSAPNPNGPFHLGNARQYLLSFAFAQEYAGRHFLRFDDTDPKIKRPEDQAIEWIREDLEWLGISIDQESFASDRLEVYYQYLKQLIGNGNAYVCQCKSDEWRKKIAKGRGCACRTLDNESQKERYKAFMDHTLKEGQAVIRLKTDLQSPDPSLRDWWLARIVDKPNHPRTKDAYHVWPSFNFQSAIDDHEFGITLIIRGQEHAQNSEKQQQLYAILGWEFPHVFHTGRVKMQGMVLSTSEIRKGIEEGVYSGWDDPKLGTIRALRKRGFSADALKEALLDIGVRSSDTTIEMNKLIDLNKKHLQGKARLLTFIENPVKLEVISSKEKSGEIDGRKFHIPGGVAHFLVSGNALKQVGEGKVFRLKQAYNAQMGERSEMAAGARFVGEQKIDVPILRWLQEGMDVEISYPDGKKGYGIVNKEAESLAEGSHVLLDAKGYGRVDATRGRMIRICYTHDI